METAVTVEIDWVTMGTTAWVHTTAINMEIL